MSKWHFVEEMTKLFCGNKTQNNGRHCGTVICRWTPHYSKQTKTGGKAAASPHHRHPAADHHLLPGSAGWACPDRGTWTPTWCSLPGRSWSPEHGKIKLKAAGQGGNNYENKKRTKATDTKGHWLNFGVKQCNFLCEAVQITSWCEQIQNDEKLFKFWCETIQILFWNTIKYYEYISLLPSSLTAL